MPDSAVSILAFAAAALPGALYIWSFERQAGRWGIGLSDRVLRFVGGSAIFHAVFAPVTYSLWSHHWQRVRNGERLPWWLSGVPLVYVVAPTMAGHLVGRAVRRDRSWTRLVTGLDPAPRAWDHLFQHHVDGWVRLRMKSGSWIGGAFATSDGDGRRSYAAGYPEPQDLFIGVAARIDPDTGEFAFTDDGDVELLAGGLLVRWEEVEYLEFIDAAERQET